MKLNIQHTTWYTFDKEVYFDPHVFLFHPKELPWQKTLEFELNVTPEPYRIYHRPGIDNNWLSYGFFKEPARQLVIEASITVENTLYNPFDFILDVTGSKGPYKNQDPLLEPFTMLNKDFPVKTIQDFVSDLKKQDWMPFLIDLNAKIYQSFTQIIRTQGGPLSFTEMIKTGEGSCRDLATLFIQVCRYYNLAARFVSGYFYQEDSHGHELHAWAEVYLEGAGWVGFDPSYNMLCADHHIPVASHADHNPTLPIQGTYRGKASSEMDFKINITCLA